MLSEHGPKWNYASLTWWNSLFSIICHYDSFDLRTLNFICQETSAQRLISLCIWELIGRTSCFLLLSELGPKCNYASLTWWNSSFSIICHYISFDLIAFFFIILENMAQRLCIFILEQLIGHTNCFLLLSEHGQKCNYVNLTCDRVKTKACWGGSRHATISLLFLHITFNT